MKLMRTVMCGELRPQHVDQTVTLAGWVNTYRDQGKGLIFIDMRDRTGLVQVVFDLEDADPDVVREARALRREDVIAVRGLVRIRVGDANPKLATGDIELVASEMEVLTKADTPPILPDDYDADKIAEETRLRYRYIDLRRPRMQYILGTRSKVMALTRRYFLEENRFLEIETPILYKSTPEGAREFLVPCRNVPGTFYALPQSPQVFKQILMMSGCDRYMQICRCFRDEDPRADRQAEFSQVDLEMSFIDRETVMNMMEGYIRRIWKEVLGYDSGAWPRMRWQEAMDRFGIDRPDTRFGLELVDISDLAAKTDFGVFKTALAKKGRVHRDNGVVKCFRIPGNGKGAEKLTRKLTDGYTEFVKQFGAGGLPLVKVVAGADGSTTFETGITKFLEPIKSELIARLGLEPGDYVFFGADTYMVCSKTLAELRLRVAKDLNLIPADKWNFLWVVDFPMFEWSNDDGRWAASHHPFTSPNPQQLENFLNFQLGDNEAISKFTNLQYDAVLNGSEIGGGSVRIHRADVQTKVFQVVGMTREEAQAKFSFLLDALRYGTPPHGGIAFGLDRLIMHLCKTDNIRDVIAFPKTQIGADLLTGAPGHVAPKQLDELHLKINLPEPEPQQPATA